MADINGKETTSWLSQIGSSIGSFLSSAAERIAPEGGIVSGALAMARQMIGTPSQSGTPAAVLSSAVERIAPEGGIISSALATARQIIYNPSQSEMPAVSNSQTASNTAQDTVPEAQTPATSGEGRAVTNKPVSTTSKETSAVETAPDALTTAKKEFVEALRALRKAGGDDVEERATYNAAVEKMMKAANIDKDNNHSFSKEERADFRKLVNDALNENKSPLASSLTGGKSYLTFEDAKKAWDESRAAALEEVGKERVANKEMTEKMLKPLDTNFDGKISENELAKGSALLKNLTPEARDALNDIAKSSIANSKYAVVESNQNSIAAPVAAPQIASTSKGVGNP